MKSAIILALFALFAVSMATPIFAPPGGFGGIGLGLGGLSYTQRIQAYPFGVGLGVGLGHPGLLFG